MKTWFRSSLLAAPFALLFLPAACAKDDTATSTADAADAADAADETDAGDAGDAADAADAADGATEVEVNADISADTTWTTGKTYTLGQHVFVDGAKLTIEPGVTVKGKAGSSLVIMSTATIDASGTKEQPIVFTSALKAGTRGAGDWGGVVLLGKAPINVTGGSEHIEGYPATDTRTGYGGTDAAHNCGTVKYVRIEFAGFELAPDNELNGLTLGGCGTGTTVDYVQVHLGADDGVEVFGGTVTLRHILVTQPDDDGLDWDFGWTGKAQFLVVQQNGLVGDAGIEADNNKNDNDAGPRSAPKIWNATFVGSDSEPGKAGKAQTGFVFRRGTAAVLENAIVAHFTDFALQVNDAKTTSLLDSGELAVKSSIFFDNGGESGTLVTKSDQDAYTPSAKVMDAAAGNELVDPKLENALDLDNPSFLLLEGSPALTGAATPPADLDATATYRGAFSGTTDWTESWTSFPKD